MRIPYLFYCGNGPDNQRLSNLGTKCSLTAGGKWHLLSVYPRAYGCSPLIDIGRKITVFAVNGISFGWHPCRWDVVYYIGFIIITVKRRKEPNIFTLISKVDKWPKGKHYLIRYSHSPGEPGKWAFCWR